MQETEPQGEQDAQLITPTYSLSIALSLLSVDTMMILPLSVLTPEKNLEAIFATHIIVVASQILPKNFILAPNNCPPSVDRRVSFGFGNIISHYQFFLCFLSFPFLNFKFQCLIGLSNQSFALKLEVVTNSYSFQII